MNNDEGRRFAVRHWRHYAADMARMDVRCLDRNRNRCISPGRVAGRRRNPANGSDYRQQPQQRAFKHAALQTCMCSDLEH